MGDHSPISLLQTLPLQMEKNLMELSEKTVEMLLESMTTQVQNLTEDLAYQKSETANWREEVSILNRQMQQTAEHKERQYIPVDDFLNLFDPEFVTTKKINTIKLVRAITGLGLKEAKDLTEKQLIPIMNGFRDKPQLPKAERPNPATMWDDEESDYTRPSNDAGHTLGDILEQALQENEDDH